MSTVKFACPLCGGHGGYPAVLMSSWAALTGQET